VRDCRDMMCLEFSQMCDAVIQLDSLFFSSRRRHTRSKRDWSSDVCSSDLGGVYYKDGTVGGGPPPKQLQRYPVRINKRKVEIKKIGRASCRERVEIEVVGVAVKEKKEKEDGE